MQRPGLGTSVPTNGDQLAETSESNTEFYENDSSSKGPDIPDISSGMMSLTP